MKSHLIQAYDSPERSEAGQEQVSPSIFSLVPVFTTGTSGEDLSWTQTLYATLHAHNAPAWGLGFHPYGVAVNNMASAMASEDAAANYNYVYVSEIGQSDASSLYNTIVNLDRWTPEITIYTYKPGPGEPGTLGLVNNPQLYSAAQQGFAYVAAHNTPGAPLPLFGRQSRTRYRLPYRLPLPHVSGLVKPYAASGREIF